MPEPILYAPYRFSVCQFTYRRSERRRLSLSETTVRAIRAAGSVCSIHGPRINANSRFSWKKCLFFFPGTPFRLSNIVRFSSITLGKHCVHRLIAFWVRSVFTDGKHTDMLIAFMVTTSIFCIPVAFSNVMLQKLIQLIMYFHIKIVT